MRTAVASLAAIATAVGVGACGGSGVSSGDVAVAGAAKISLAQFHHWASLANNSAYVNTGVTPVALPVPPDYTACIASERPREAKGTSTSALKTICATSYDSTLLPDAIDLLVEGYWIQGEAVDRHVSVKNSAVAKAFAKEERQEWPTTKKLDNFLGESGYTVKDLEYIERLDLLEQAILKRVENKAAKVTQKKIRAYYNAHISQYTQAARLNIELVLAKNATIAATAKSKLAGGASFATVAKKYSIDPTTKANGGKAAGVERGEETPAFNTAIFAAPVGKLEGPVKTAFGYYVFKVTKSVPKSVESFTTASAAIKSQLVTSQQNAAVTKLRNTFSKKWKARTTCGSDYLVTAVCSNAPASASTGSSGTSSG